MPVEPPPEILPALQLVRMGQFSDALVALEQRTQAIRKNEPLTLALLADTLQRVGQNDRAEEIALRVLKPRNAAPQVVARCHFALGNVHRDRGDTPAAMEHLQAATLNNSDIELSCWAQLRLMAVIAELSGAQTAMARLDEVKRALTKFGDGRPFAALHLWMVEVESMRGNLESAMQHRNTASSLLATAENIWLRGYLAINSSVLHYYLAEIIEAKRWAQIAITCASKSGHRSTLRSAYANLGSIELSLGNYLPAEQCFAFALNCCEHGTVPEIAILDNIAQIHLYRGDLAECRSFIARLDNLIEQNNYDKRRHYNACALQTKIRLLLTEGKNAEALRFSQMIIGALKGLTRPRITTETHLLNIEALLANGQSIAAANALTSAFLAISSLPPELFAKFEHVSGRALASSEAFDLACLHLERAVQTFNTIGHCLGKDLTRRELDTLPQTGTEDSSITIGSQRSLDRIRALMDQRTRPELFGYEAAALLKDLACTSKIELVVDELTNKRVLEHYCENRASTVATPISITFGSGQRVITLSFVPLDDARSKLTALSFYRVLKQILAIGCTEAGFGGQDIVWTTNEGCGAKQGAIFRSESMVAILRILKQVGPTDVSVLITGETGAGKEVIAKTIHEYSRRAALPFLALNCAAVPKDLLESQLFGHRKGAFSGAIESHQGIVRAANGGTLFLDEIGELPFDMQAKLLRFLEMNEVHPIGESHPVKVNVRLIFATNGDLEEAVSQNRFRQDLYYRLSVIPIKVPPLRERRDEIPVLAHLFSQRFASEFEKEALRFSSNAMEMLILYSWPGNIRQLANEVRRLSALMESGACVEPEHLLPQLQAPRMSSRTDAREDTPQLRIRIDQPLEKATADLETEMIKRALQQAGGRVSDAASALGISRKGLYLKRLRLGLTDNRVRAH
jgi:DNA-binding NtrC family response regulator/tetratricopeptide (TPR) repeat protein